MSSEHRVNLGAASGHEQHPEEPPERPRWWLRNPPLGVAIAVALGIATVWVTSSFQRPASDELATVIYIVILPIALLLPACALSAALIAWFALRAATGRLRLMLAVPAAAAVVLNAIAIGLFIRWLTRVFTG